MKRIAIFGGSFNPPGLHHRRIVELVSAMPDFDEVIVLPCGIRPDKQTVGFVPAIHRAALVDMTFANIPKVTVDLTDLEKDTFTPTIDLEERYTDIEEIWHVIGSDLLVGGGDGKSVIQCNWKNGSKLWQTAHFLVCERNGVTLREIDMPSNGRIIETDIGDIARSSTDIRGRIFDAEPFEDLVMPNVAKYIKRYGLYRGGFISNTSSWTPPKKLQLAYNFDTHNINAERAVEKLAGLYTTSDIDPDLIVSLGGDGKLLKAIRANWRRRVPFVGLNFGHHGFLLNPPDTNLNQPLSIFHLPLLYVKVVDLRGIVHRGIAVNDVWLERACPSTAWLSVSANGKEMITKLESDGILVATPQGSCAYARSMGAPPMPLDSNIITLVGNNVAYPLGWRFAMLPSDTKIEVATLEPSRRPVRAVIDGDTVIENAVSLTVRQSNIAAIELAFDPRVNISDKIVAAQFPARS